MPPRQKKLLDAMLKRGRAGAISLGFGWIDLALCEWRSALCQCPRIVWRSCVGSGRRYPGGIRLCSTARFATAEAVRLAVACGSANCLAPGPGRARLEDIVA